MTRVFLVRHGTHDVVGKVLAGRMPGVSLSAEGHRQAVALADHFAGAQIRAVWSSPLERCQQTAAPIAQRHGLRVELSEALIEIDCGEWTGKSFEVLTGDPRWRAWNAERGQAAVPGGETAAAVCARVMGLLQKLMNDGGGATILVTHSDIIKFAMLGLLGAALDVHDRLEIDPASVTTLDLWHGGGKIVRSNQIVSL
ncbi:histidine phosphatase family protein [Lichenifustis flavocetrariae]|uniref:Histidine phosphatase family protein n=1 Tax=Lichenifustis flavocetrariae TaxID=2949735 RepID=A0AA42CIS2_9HYPH|nr:histidine phosphatase family protein [Lichenifustis flavocetrariae]MCW6507186.1 histidine phosphatase family protein [Lichenifustis flavocetrariae]